LVLGDFKNSLNGQSKRVLRLKRLVSLKRVLHLARFLAAFSRPPTTFIGTYRVNHFSNSAIACYHFVWCPHSRHKFLRHRRVGVLPIATPTTKGDGRGVSGTEFQSRGHVAFCFERFLKFRSSVFLHQSMPHLDICRFHRHSDGKYYLFKVSHFAAGVRCPMTDTELKLMAAPAMMGLRKRQRTDKARQRQ